MKVKKIEKVEDFDGLVYSLNVEDNHNFFLDNGILSKNCLMILDEVQNCDLRQIMLFVTRLGKNSKLILSGDTRQYDISKDFMGINYFADVLCKDIPSVNIFNFNENDIMRNSILIELTKRYELMKYDKMLPKNKK